MQEYILTFHGVGQPPVGVEPSDFSLWVGCDEFNAILDEVVAWNASGRCPVSVTFDDGNRSDMTRALPALLARGLTARFFVCAGRIGERGYLEARDLPVMIQEGMIIGSHGMDHIDWRVASDCALDREIVEARRILSDMCRCAIDEVAIPFGSYDRRVLARLRCDAVWRHVYTSDRGPARPDEWIKPRNSVSHSSTAASELVRTLAAERPLRRLARALLRSYKKSR